MAPPFLKLVFLKGPREGETLDYHPGSTVRVGRIVRGNDLAIKDAGISTKHLRIESDSEKWMIRDLGSSNGTILNSTSLPADTSFVLSHGDTVKLGEYTSIEVSFVIGIQGKDAIPEAKLPPKPRRTNRRKAVVELDPVGVVQENPGRKGRPAKQRTENSKESDSEHEQPLSVRASTSIISENVADEVKVLEENDEKVNSRVTRARKNRSSAKSCLDGKKTSSIDLEKEEDVGEERQGKQLNPRVRRNVKIESTQSLYDSDKLEYEEIAKGVENLEVRDEKIVTRRRTRNKKIESVQNSSSGLENIENADTVIEVSERKDGNKVNAMITRSRMKEVAREPYLELEMVENQARKRRAGKKRKEEKPLESNKDIHAGEEAQISTVDQDKENEKQHDVFDTRHDCEAKRDCSEAGNEESSGIGEAESFRKETEGNNGESNKGNDFRIVETNRERGEEEKGTRMSHGNGVEQLEVDLGKMTLGQWFDFLEVNLPKQIIDETEKMIEPMQSKSKRVYDYIKEQKSRII